MDKLAQIERINQHRRADGKFGHSPAVEVDLSEVDLEDVSRDWTFNSSVSEQEVLKICRDFAAKHSHRFQYDDVDDYASETAEHYLRHVKNQQGKVLSGQREPTEDFNVSRYIRTVSIGLGQRHASGLQHGGRDLQALTKFLKTKEEFEARYERPMTRTERDVMAEEIRMSAPPGRRAKKDYHNTPGPRHFASLEGLTEDSSWEPTPIHAEQEAPEPSINDDAAHDVLDAMHDLKPGAATQMGRKKLWPVMSMHMGAAQVAEESISSTEASSVRDTIETHGGVEAVLERFESGSASDPETAALFAPWGGRAALGGADEEDKVVATLSQRPRYTAEVWDAALFAATTTKQKRKANT